LIIGIVLFFRKAGFDALQKKTQEEQKAQEHKNAQYGAWGPLYKNKQNFVNMHSC
jgi:hypothetical protein